MKYGVRVKLNVSQIDKARLFRGEKGMYLDATVFIDTEQESQWGDNGMVTQDVSKEERDQGIKGNILGNVKVFWSGPSDQPQQAPQQNYQQAPQQQKRQAPQQQRQAPKQSPNQNLPQSNQYQQSQQQPQGAPNFDDFDDDIPF